MYIGANSHVEAGCQILGPTWIGHGWHLQGGARITRSILFEHTRIGSHGIVEEAVVFGRNCVDKDGKPIHTGYVELDWVTDARDLAPLRAVGT